MKGKFLVISGPSGSGKTTLINMLLNRHKDLYFSVSSTTRSPREGEKDGINYNFISQEEFEEGIKKDEFLEWAFVHKNYYGSSLKPCIKALNDGKTVLFDIDVQGHRIAKNKFPELITSIFLTTPNKKELENRLISRGSDDKNSIEKRLFNAEIEMQDLPMYDYILLNKDLQTCFYELDCIYESLKHKSKNLNLNSIIDNWKN